MELDSISEWESVVFDSGSGQVEGRKVGVSAVLENGVLSVGSVSGFQASVTHGSDVSGRSTIEGNLLVVDGGGTGTLDVEWSSNSVLSRCELGSKS